MGGKGITTFHEKIADVLCNWKKSIFKISQIALRMIGYQHLEQYLSNC